MFEWYRKAEICYAYLSDVPSADDDHEAKASPFRKSKWFTRGWTLQELLAPQWVEFFDWNWAKIGTKSSLERLIQSITNINYLSNFDEACVAQKMSWASKRQTSRLEDQAYCLMGLFDVNMPLLYGEGHNAFFRLQLEILSKTDDDSLFAWEQFDRGSGHGLLASSPAFFTHSSDVQRRGFDNERPPSTMTNQGLRMELLVVPRLKLSPHLAWFGGFTASVLADVEKNFLAPLNCTRDGEGLVISLHNSGHSHYRRIRLESIDLLHLENIKGDLTRRVVYVKQQQYRHKVLFDPGFFSRTILIKTRMPRESGFHILEKYVRSSKGAYWDTGSDGSPILRYFLLQSDLATAALLFSNGGPECLIVILVMSYTDARVEFFVKKGTPPLAEYVQSRESFRSLQALDFGGTRSLRFFADGKSVFVDIKKEDDSLRQIYVLDIKIHLEEKMWPHGRPLVNFYQFV